jgi:hypothetical protein
MRGFSTVTNYMFADIDREQIGQLVMETFNVGS